MRRTIIKSINGYDYIVLDDNNNQYQLNLEFYGIDKKMSLGDIIYFPSKLLKNNGVYSFGIIKNVNNNMNEYIKLIIDNKEYYLERYYG